MSIIYLGTTNFLTVTLPILIMMFLIFILLYALIIFRFGGIEEEEVALVLSFEDRFDINLGPLKKVAERLM